jgi:hypothetical protein
MAGAQTSALTLVYPACNLQISGSEKDPEQGQSWAKALVRKAVGPEVWPAVVAVGGAP